MKKERKTEKTGAPSVEIIWSRYGVMKKGQQIQPHYHRCYQFYYILRGQCEYVIDGQVFQVKSHDYFYITPMLKHSMRPVAENELILYDVKMIIHEKAISEHLPKVSAPKCGDDFVGELISFVYDKWVSKDEMNQDAISHIMCMLLNSFYLSSLRIEEQHSSLVRAVEYPPLVQSMLVYIERNHSDSFTLQRMGEDLHYNKNYLSTLFSHATGISIVDYLNLVRIRTAVIFLAYYDQDILTTYESAGFSNASHFSRTFKELVGVSPRSFRKAFSSSGDERITACYLDEPLLNYKSCTISEMIQSFKNLGRIAAETANEKT